MECCCRERTDTYTDKDKGGSPSRGTVPLLFCMRIVTGGDAIKNFPRHPWNTSYLFPASCVCPCPSQRPETLAA